MISNSVCRYEEVLKRSFGKMYICSYIYMQRYMRICIFIFELLHICPNFQQCSPFKGDTQNQRSVLLVRKSTTICVPSLVIMLPTKARWFCVFSRNIWWGRYIFKSRLLPQKLGSTYPLTLCSMRMMSAERREARDVGCLLKSSLDRILPLFRTRSPICGCVLRMASGKTDAADDMMTRPRPLLMFTALENIPHIKNTCSG